MTELRAHADTRVLADSRAMEPSLGQYQTSLFDEPAGDDQAQLLADYRQRYGLAEDPFSDDYSFPLFTGAGRRQVLDRLLHLCQFSNSLLVVVAEDGVGKTRVAHAFMDSLSEDDNLSFLPLKAGQSQRELLASIVEDLELACAADASEPELIAALDNLMGADPLEDERLAVVVIDNAHLLGRDSLQTLVDLLLRHPQQNALHFVLFGEPSLMTQLDNCTQEGLLLNDFYLQPFSLAETVDYLNFRMEMADYLGPEIFTETMVNPWWRQAQGQLRSIHSSAQERLLESVVAPKVPVELKRNLPVAHILAISGLIALVAILFLYMDDEPATAELAQPAPVAPAVTGAPDLTRTDTPVKPLMQALPGTAATSAPAAIPAPSVEDKQIPLAELPVTPAPVTTTPATVAPGVPAATQPEPTAPVAAAPEVREPAPEPKAKPQPSIQAPKPQATTPSPAGLTSQEQAILGWPASSYTIQLLGVSTEKAARDYIAAQSNRNNLLLFKSRRQGRDWFVVVTGRYASNQLARQAIAGLPASQREAGPWPREVGAIQQEIRASH